MKIWISNAGHRERLSPELRRQCRLVVLTVASATGVRYCDFFAPSRMRLHTASARQLAMYLCHTLLGLTMTQVGQFFGRDRTTVAHACKQVEDGRDEGSPADIEIVALEARIDSARSEMTRTAGREMVHARA